jgi:hypothetical protein
LALEIYQMLVSEMRSSWNLKLKTWGLSCWRMSHSSLPKKLRME